MCAGGTTEIIFRERPWSNSGKGAPTMGGHFSSRQGPPHSIDWYGPSVMFVCFVGAIILAIGHHILNLQLEGKAITEFILDQQWVSRSGNAIAYLVKLLLVLATGTSYFQCVWHHSRGRPTKISQFDSMFGVLDNIFELRHLAFWFRRPILLWTVAIVWYV